MIFADAELGFFEWTLIVLVLATFACVGLTFILIAWAILRFEIRAIFGKLDETEA